MSRRAFAGVSISLATLLAGIGVSSARQGGGGPIFLPGTQPGQVSSITPAVVCDLCHSFPGDPAFFESEPFFTWKGSMMANAARDPVFRAALAIANQDVPGVGEWCLRCHAPGGWLQGNSQPPNGANLGFADLDGVHCDVCHRLVDPFSAEGQALVQPDVTSLGNAMMVVDPGNPPAEAPKRGPYDDSFSPFHETIFSPFHRRGEICGTCHDVSNPLMPDPAHPYNVQKQHVIERTFSEWRHSSFYGAGESGNCQACHMRNVPNYACNLLGIAPFRSFQPTHEFTGGNSWVPQVIGLLFTDVHPQALRAGRLRAEATLRSAAKLWVTTHPTAGATVARVRVRNETGHKLPTGYPEGRRMWLHVAAYDAGGSLLAESGAYDAGTATLLPDPQIKVYEVKPGVRGAAGCQPSFHLVLNDCIVKENRIPPRGFSNAAFETFQGEPVGATYLDGQYWDDTVYLFPPQTAEVRARLRYQTASREYVEFLKNENTTDNWGQILYDAWLQTGKSAPVDMLVETSDAGPFAQYGTASAGAGGYAPLLSAGGQARPGGAVHLIVSAARGGSVGAFVFGFGPASVPTPCGTLSVDPFFTFLVRIEGGAGVAGGGGTVYTVPLPPDPNLSGLRAHLQLFAQDPNGPAGICTVSNAVQVTIG